MGRKKIANRKINKSGRFDPHLLEEVEKVASKISLNFSQTLEFLTEIGVAVAADDSYQKIADAANADTMTVPMKVREIVRKSSN